MMKRLYYNDILDKIRDVGKKKACQRVEIHFLLIFFLV